MSNSRPIQKNDLLLTLPTDISQKYLPSYFDWYDYDNALQVNQVWLHLFSHISWQYKLILKFNIDKNALHKVLGFIKPTSKEFFFKDVFRKLTLAIKHAPRYIANIYLNPEDHVALIACCSDNVEALTLIPHEEYGLWFEFALFVGCNSIAKEIFRLENNPAFEKFYSQRSKEIIQLLLANLKLNHSHNVGEFPPTENALNDAAKSGNLFLVQRLIKCYQFTPQQTTLTLAAQSGNLALVRFLLDPNNNFKLTPDYTTIKEAVTIGSLSIVRLLTAPPYNIKIGQSLLHLAIACEHYRLVHYFLDRHNNFNLALVTGIYCQDNLSLRLNLLPCEKYINGAMIRLRLDGREQVPELLLNAKNANANYFTNFVRYVAANPKHLRANEQLCQWFLNLEICKAALQTQNSPAASNRINGPLI